MENRRVAMVDRGDVMNWEIGFDVCAPPCVKQIASGNCYIAQGAQLGVL